MPTTQQDKAERLTCVIALGSPQEAAAISLIWAAHDTMISGIAQVHGTLAS